MTHLRLILITCVLACGCMATSAQTMKPGLWEMNTKMTSGSGEMEKAMAESRKHMDAMPPAQRKQMEEMMAKQGITLGKPGGGMSIKVCMTKEMIDRNEIHQQEGNCKQTSSKKTGSTMQFSVVCTDPPSNAEGLVTFISPEAYTSKMTIHSKRQGKSESMLMENSGRFLSNDCGSVKPIALKAK